MTEREGLFISDRFWRHSATRLKVPSVRHKGLPRKARTRPNASDFRTALWPSFLRHFLVGHLGTLPRMPNTVTVLILFRCTLSRSGLAVSVGGARRTTSPKKEHHLTLSMFVWADLPVRVSHLYSRFDPLRAPEAFLRFTFTFPPDPIEPTESSV